MRNFLQDVATQLRGIWARLEGPQRLVVSAVTLATLVGLGAIVWFAGQPSYEVVFSATSGDETARAQQALQKAGMSWQLDDSGMRLMVDRDKVGRARAAIAGEGLMGTREVSLDTSGSFIEDAATKKWRLNNATRAQAEQAILKLGGVHSVTVTGSKPDRMVAFRDRQDEQKAKATVVLGLRPGAPFESTAYGAASIAASQLMIPLANIDVFSASGASRWSYNPDRNSGAGSSEFLAMQRDMSDTRTRLAQARLEQLYGDKISVQVHVELDPKWEVRREKVLPDEPLMKKEEMTKDSTDGAAPSEDVAGSKSKNEKRTREYVTEIGERRTGVAMPEIKRVTFAVLYDKKLEDPGGADEREPLVPTELERTVKAIVGWSKARDFKTDEDPGFSIMTGTFQAPAQAPVAIAGPGMGDMALEYAPVIGQLLGVVIVVLFLRGLFKRSRKAAPAAAPATDVADVEVAPEEQQRRMRREIERSIADDPAALAKMLEAWLMEQKV
ncbi:MAG: flagellar M-ring protein FliF C-terminal domain-containing protein [Planctomycetota bacterium]